MERKFVTRPKTHPKRPHIELIPAEVTALAESVISKQHLADELGISHDTLDRRLKDSPEISEAYRQGKRNLRRYVASVMLMHAPRNALAAITLANQPDILGFSQPSQRVDGRIDVVHSLSPAQLAFKERREIQQLSMSPKGDYQEVEVTETPACDTSTDPST